ncbi:hypothetical protein [Paratractidigestivibacter sp.]|uniref:hypothetical protein n=1 Tax=Paratractidigestivibacter sp. TaxID=2847316 RepID=UPI002AC91D16|nr:hypothetical protein [Paratractidigestivibacter sp.]
MAVKLDVAVAPLGRDRVFKGCSLVTCDEKVFSDASTLAREFAAVKNDVAGRVMPVVTAVCAGNAGDDGTYRYFMGDEVEKRGGNKGLEELLVPAGTLVAVVPVKFHMEASAALRAAQVRQAFYDGWLPGSCYECASDELGFADVELYHYRKRRFRRAKKMVLNLMFVLREKTGA